MRLCVDMGEAMAGRREVRDPKLVARRDVALHLDLRRPAEVRSDRHAQVDDLHRYLSSCSARPRESGPSSSSVLGPWIPACAGMSGDGSAMAQNASLREGEENMGRLANKVAIITGG